MNNKPTPFYFDPIHPDDPVTPPEPDRGVYDKTPNYEFMLHLPESMTSWLTVFNTNMLKIDTAIHSIALRTSIDGDIPPELSNDVDKLLADVADINNTIKEHTEQLELYLESITSLQTNTTRNTTNIQTLFTNYTNADTRLMTLENAFTDLRSTVEKVSNNLESLTDRVETLEQKVATLEGGA